MPREKRSGTRGERGREYRETAARENERERESEGERETEQPRSYRPLHGTNAMYAATDRPSCDPSVYNRAAALRAPDTAYIAYHATAACRYIHLRYIPLAKRVGSERDGGIYVRYTAPRRPSARMCASADVKTYTRSCEKYIDISRYICITGARVYIYKYMYVLHVYRRWVCTRWDLHMCSGAPQKADVPGIDEARGAPPLSRRLDLRISVDRRLMPRTPVEMRRETVARQGAKRPGGDEPRRRRWWRRQR